MPKPLVYSFIVLAIRCVVDGNLIDVNLFEGNVFVTKPICCHKYANPQLYYLVLIIKSESVTIRVACWLLLTARAPAVRSTGPVLLDEFVEWYRQEHGLPCVITDATMEAV